MFFPATNTFDCEGGPRLGLRRMTTPIHPCSPCSSYNLNSEQLLPQRTICPPLSHKYSSSVGLPFASSCCRRPETNCSPWTFINNHLIFDSWNCMKLYLQIPNIIRPSVQKAAADWFLKWSVLRYPFRFPTILEVRRHDFHKSKDTSSGWPNFEVALKLKAQSSYGLSMSKPLSTVLMRTWKEAQGDNREIPLFVP